MFLLAPRSAGGRGDRFGPRGVEGREQFSRPQLMTKVRQAEASESSREDRLRSFGQLLREGKIEKTRGGRFTASERISFKPDARAAG